MPPRTPLRIIAFVIVASLIASCNKEPAILRQMEKSLLVRDLSQGLLASAEAEKRAVLATSDEESAAFAAESKRSATEVERVRGQLAQPIEADARSSETEALAAFDAAWSQVKAIDARLLALAVQNTNLKATRLAVGEGAAALDRLVVQLAAMEESSTDLSVVRDLSSAARAALRIQSYQLEHIPLAADAEMRQIEQRIEDLAVRVDAVLTEVRAIDPPPGNVAAATKAWADYRRIAGEVTRLSRQNTNVISFDLAVHEKHDATQAALAALAKLETAVASGPHPTR